jgi:hypothetical protein
MWWLLLLVLRRWTATATVWITAASSEIPSAFTTAVVVAVVGRSVVVVIVVHSHSSSVVHVLTTTTTPASATTTGRRRDESGPDPAPIPRGFVVIKGNSRALVGVLLPSVGKGRNHAILLATGTNVSLLCRGQSHSALLPFHNVCLIVQFEILPELPTSALLFAAGGTVMGQIRVGIIVKEAGHGEMNQWMVGWMNESINLYRGFFVFVSYPLNE